MDLNGDRVAIQFTTADKITYDSQTVAISGQQSSAGIMPTPGIIDDVDKEYKYIPGTSGLISTIAENPGQNASGRQSWRQLK